MPVHDWRAHEPIRTMDRDMGNEKSSLDVGVRGHGVFLGRPSLANAAPGAGQVLRAAGGDVALTVPSPVP